MNYVVTSIEWQVSRLMTWHSYSIIIEPPATKQPNDSSTASSNGTNKASNPRNSLFNHPLINLSMESTQPRQSKYTRTQEAAFQKLWSWNYLQKFPVALYAPLQELVCAMSDEAIETFLHILETLFAAQDKVQAAKFPTGGYLSLENAVKSPVNVSSETVEQSLRHITGYETDYHSFLNPSGLSEKQERFLKKLCLEQDKRILSASKTPRWVRVLIGQKNCDYYMVDLNRFL